MRGWTMRPWKASLTSGRRSLSAASTTKTTPKASKPTTMPRPPLEYAYAGLDLCIVVAPDVPDAGAAAQVVELQGELRLPQRHPPEAQRRHHVRAALSNSHQLSPQTLPSLSLS